MRSWFLPWFVPVLVVLLVALAGCGGKGAQAPGAPPKPAGQSKPAEPASPQPAGAGPLTAREACTRLAESARQWSEDAQPYKLGGRAEDEGPAITGGRCSSWRFWFASAAKKEIRVYSFKKDGQPTWYPEAGGGSVSYEVPDWSGYWQVDSDRAAEVATEQGIKQVTALHLYLRCRFVTTPREVPETCNVFWDVYGKDSAGNGQHVYVDAKTGAVLK